MNTGYLVYHIKKMAGAQPTTEDQNYMISQKELLNSKNILKYQQPVLRIQVGDAYGTL